MGRSVEVTLGLIHVRVTPHLPKMITISPLSNANGARAPSNLTMYKYRSFKQGIQKHETGPSFDYYSTHDVQFGRDDGTSSSLIR